jgi:hypothetical protein
MLPQLHVLRNFAEFHTEPWLPTIQACATIPSAELEPSIDVHSYLTEVVAQAPLYMEARVVGSSVWPGEPSERGVERCRYSSTSSGVMPLSSPDCRRKALARL